MPSVGWLSSTSVSFGPGEYAPTEEAYTRRETPASATAPNTRSLPTTFTDSVSDSSREGWMAHARCTTASAPANSLVRSADRTSAAAHSTFGSSREGRRRAIPRIESTSASSTRDDRTLVPTFPVAPTTTTLMAGQYPWAPATNRERGGLGEREIAITFKSIPTLC